MNITKIFNRLAAYISDNGVANYSPRAIGLFAVILLLAITSIYLKVHQSSIAIWDEIHGPPSETSSLISGIPKKIRSDEWLTQTPWILNQVHKGSKEKNSNIGAATSPLMVGAPVFNSLIIFQPKFWGFILFDIERGYAWLWAFKTLGLFASFFILFYCLSNDDLVVSIAGSLWILGSSFTQWWFSSNLPEQLIGFALALSGTVYLLKSTTVKGMTSGGVILLFGATTSITHLYPAFQLPLFYLYIAITFAIIINKNKCTESAINTKHRIAAILASAIAVLAVCGIWVATNFETIKIIQQTVYPGKRVNLGGGLSFDQMWYGFFEGIRNSEFSYPLPASNASETSSFILLFPAALLFLLTQKGHQQRTILIAAVACCTLFAFWAALPLPIKAREYLTLLGFGLTTSSRIQLGIGVSSIIACTILTSITSKNTQHHRNQIASIIIAGFILFISILSYRLHFLNTEFFTHTRLTFGAIITTLILLSIIKGYRLLFLASVALATLPSFTVNPFNRGLDSILQKPAFIEARKVTQHQDQKWITVGSYAFAQGLKASGLNVINGSNFTPDTSWVKFFDPSFSKSRIWNRYAHITIESDPSQDDPTFTLLSADSYVIKYKICSKPTISAGIDLVAYTKPVPAEDLACLKEIYTDPGSQITYYEVQKSKIDQN